MSKPTDHRRTEPSLADPPETAGYWRLQSPLTREPRIHVATNEEAFAAIQVVAGAIAYCIARPGLAASLGGQQGSTPAPAGGRPWRWQWPARHVPAGCRLTGQRDYQLSERAMVAGIRPGLRERTALEAAGRDEAPAGER